MLLTDLSIKAMKAPEQGAIIYTDDTLPGFGRFEINGEAFLWKIDYYDLDLERGSEDPADIKKTCRVLTVMRTDEW
jgi:hypothetical protein